MEPYAPLASSRAAMRHDATNGATALWAIFLHLTVRHAPPAYVSHGHRSDIPQLWCCTQGLEEALLQDIFSKVGIGDLATNVAKQCATAGQEVRPGVVHRFSVVDVVYQ